MWEDLIQMVAYKMAIGRQAYVQGLLTLSSSCTFREA